MVTQKEIQSITQKIVSVVKPQRVYLFGSYALGKQHPESDLDFLIVMPDRTKKKHEVVDLIQKKIRSDSDCSKDLIVDYIDNFNRFSNIPYSFIGHIVKTGVLLYES